MPLTMMESGSNCVVRRVFGAEDVCRHLENLGIVKGVDVGIVSNTPNGVIVNVKESRLALGRELASRIFV